MATPMEPTRTGKVMMDVGRDGRKTYEEFSVQDVDGDVYYYHGGPTCCTSDGWVHLPEEYRDKVRWAMYDMGRKDEFGGWEDCGQFPTREAARRAAEDFGPGEYGVGPEDDGHYDEFFHIASESL